MATLPAFDTDDLKDVVGGATYARGVEHAKRYAIAEPAWSPAKGTLSGPVPGSRGDTYRATVYFHTIEGEPAELQAGQCTCPVGYNCKHVTALVLAAADAGRRAARPVSWETSLGYLLEHEPVTPRTPLAIELTLTGRSPLAKLVKQGKRGWIASGLSWTKLAALHHYDEHPSEQLRVLQELFALYQAHNPSRNFYGDVRTIDLSGFDSHQLWPLLEEAATHGVRLVHGGKDLGELDPPTSGDVCLDVTTASGDGLAVAPSIRLGGVPADAVPVAFIGSGGHGLVYVDRADTERSDDPAGWRLRLARLNPPAPPQLQRMALEREKLSIPPGELPRFRDEYCPRLRTVATLVSSDSSFTPPKVSGPKLIVHAEYGKEHALEVSWEWAYRVGESKFRDPLGTEDVSGYRDLGREEKLLAALDVPPGFAPRRKRLACEGVDTMQFTTEVLPLLRGRPDVEVEVTGQPADYREAGDSLSIGFSTAELVGKRDWFGLDIAFFVEGHPIAFINVFLALSRGESQLLLPSGAYFSLLKPEFQTLKRLMEEARMMQDKPSGPLQISRYQVTLWDELTALGVVDQQAEAWRRQLADLRSLDQVGAVDPPASLTAHLRPYQVDGFRWLAFLWKFGLGGILADDMGLGKTVQTLALICHAQASAPFLIVAPTSVAPNWAAEAARFAPGLKVVVLTDTLKKRKQTLAEAIGDADVVVTSYTLFRLDIDAYTEREWAGLVLDEAQFVKNHNAKAHQCARKLDAPFKLAITGTPMENNLMELWSLLSITAPGLFPNPHRFEEYYVRPIEKRGDPEKLGRLRRRIKPLVKRRTKEQVAADLPEKQEQVLEVNLHPKHRRLYQTHLQRERQKILGLVRDLDKNRFTIFQSLTLLRRLSLDAGLVDEEHSGLPSAKVDALVEQLQDVTGGGHRALVFSQFTGFLDVVRKRLEAEGFTYCYLDGSTRRRGEVIERFKTGTDPVFLISLKAGGFGLNLTEADYCFLLDPWWNPASEAQAVDRTHRIGQTRNVMVYRLIAKDTIEQKVMALKAKKAELVASVMDDGNAFGSGLDAEDIRGLFA
ncbi:Helicase conserved C-terminal domain-containing protein [Amycolatopsis xylanica]|uniref:Helicase conserved C-terminal domain-containing protein n=1 Tax=Amycolatopsis xylanica TaxID=589385 RepID=A0A1H3HJ21_9PSEU|nr:DEAD/DEAH box helicase [Amycolatopsis xylanica]SDY15553.1 Helicase conserved C-terminal domain-containing protein [Amycolatopsis xylanica]